MAAHARYRLTLQQSEPSGATSRLSDLQTTTFTGLAGLTVGSLQALSDSIGEFVPVVLESA
jgi:hypothetical protein